MAARAGDYVRVLGLLAAYAVPAAWRVPVFVLSFLAGAWFPAEEVWERLQQRAIDVHFSDAGRGGGRCQHRCMG